jgi:hypothetical protein
MGKLLKLNFIGNAPIGVLTGLKKVYFFKAQVDKTFNYEELIKQNDFIWVCKDELKNFVKSEEYLNTINKFILDF